MAGARFVVAAGIIGGLGATSSARAAPAAEETRPRPTVADPATPDGKDAATCGPGCPPAGVTPQATGEAIHQAPAMPEICALAPEFRARLQQQLNASAPDPSTPWVEVEFGATPDGRVSGRVRLIPTTTSAFKRQVVGQACDDVMQALAFSFELYLDEQAQRIRGTEPCSDPQPEPETEPTHPAPPNGEATWPGPDIDPFTLPRAGYQADPPPGPHIPEGPPRGTAQGLVSVGFGLLPTPSLGLAMIFRTRLEGGSFAAFGLHQHLGEPVGLGDEAFGFSSTALSVAFGRFIAAEKVFRLAALAGPRVSMVHASWFDGEARWSHHFGLALCGTLEFALHLETGWSTGLRAEGLFNVVRTHLVAETGADLWLQPWAGADLGWFLAANFW